MDYQTIDQGSTNKTLYIIVAIMAVVIVAFGFWYLYAKQTRENDIQSSSIVEQTQNIPQTGGNTIPDISNDLNQILDDSAALDQDAALSAQDVSGF